jgi:small subunit ribosomal protein S17
MPETANAVTPAESTAHRKQRVGEVVSDKMAKTIIVRVERRFRHPRFTKVVTAHKKFYAHDEGRLARVGDLVRIEETRPLSRLKRWRLVEVLNPDGSSRPGAVAA